MDQDQVALAEEAYENENFQLAADIYRNAIEKDAADALAHLGLARSLGRQGYYKRAALEGRKALKLDPDLALAHRVIADSYFRLRKNELAMTEVQKAILLDLSERSLSAIYSPVSVSSKIIMISIKQIAVIS